jgi:hypothetical protein
VDVSLSRDPGKARAWQDRSRARAAARAREARPTPVKARSAKRDAAMVERRPLVARLLAETPRCPARIVCRGARTTDVHERLSRARGGSIVDERHGHMVALCRGCHDWITTHPAEAEAARWALPSWHACPPVGPC